MPFAGGVWDQPGGVMKRFEVILDIRSEDEQRELERIKNEPPPK